MGVPLMGISENVWLQVAALVTHQEKFLVIKRQFGSLANQWSLPSGFVNSNETLDEAAARYVKEDTGITCFVKGVFGIRSGVTEDGIGDHMIVFEMASEEINIKSDSSLEVAFFSIEELKKQEKVSRLIKFFFKEPNLEVQSFDRVNPGHQFEYKRYKIIRT